MRDDYKDPKIHSGISCSRSTCGWRILDRTPDPPTLWGHLGFPAAAHFGHIADHFDHIANLLGLSDLQKAEVKQVLRSHGEEILSQIQSQIGMREELRDLIMAGTVDEGLIRQRAEAI